MLYRKPHTFQHRKGSYQRQIQLNSELEKNPWIINDSPYSDGWLALLEPSQFAVDEKDLLTVHNSQEKFLAQIKQLRIRCFAAFPDHEMFEIGVECAMVLAKLNDLMTKVPVGDVVHVVSDDATTPIEMRRWAEQTGQKIVEIRKESNLYHVIARKVK
jgi:tRNA 2-thiouridine synthesizing protein A